MRNRTTPSESSTAFPSQNFLRANKKNSPPSRGFLCFFAAFWWQTRRTLEGMQRGAAASAAGLPAHRARRRHDQVNDSAAAGDNGATCHYYAPCSASRRPLIWQPGITYGTARPDVIWTNAYMMHQSRPIATFGRALCLPTLVLSDNSQIYPSAYLCNGAAKI